MASGPQWVAQLVGGGTETWCPGQKSWETWGADTPVGVTLPCHSPPWEGSTDPNPGALEMDRAAGFSSQTTARGRIRVEPGTGGSKGRGHQGRGADGRPERAWL